LQISMRNVYFQKDFFNLKELSEYSGLGIRFLRGALKDPKHSLPHYRINNKTIIVSRIAFIAWLEKYELNHNNKIDTIVNQVMDEMKQSIRQTKQ